MSGLEHRAPTALLEAMERAGEAAVYLPVQRQNHHGGMMTPDMIVAIPIPLWEALLEAFDDFDTGWQP